MTSSSKRFLFAAVLSTGAHWALWTVFQRLPKQNSNQSPEALVLADVPVEFIETPPTPSIPQRPLSSAHDREIDLSRFLNLDSPHRASPAEASQAWHLSESGGTGGSGSSGDRGSGLLDLSTPSNSAIGASSGVAVAARGSDTMESQPFRFASFFARLRGALEPAWQWRVGRLKNPGARRDAYITAVEVQLSPEGRVLGTQLKSSSGWTDADLAALQAVSQIDRLQQLPPELYREIEGRLHLRFHLKVKPDGFSWSKVEDPRFKDL